LAQGGGSTDQEQQGLYKNSKGQYSTIWLEQAKLVSAFIITVCGTKTKSKQLMTVSKTPSYLEG